MQIIRHTEGRWTNHICISNTLLTMERGERWATTLDEVNVVSLANSAGLLRKKLLRCFTISACGKSITVTRTK